MTKKDIIKEIKAIKKTWKPSLINIIKHNRVYYSNGGYWIDVVKLNYKSIDYQINIDGCMECVLFEV
jgi:hypothetical protein